MAGISKEAAQANLDAWVAASAAVAKNQRYKIGDREYTRADAAEIRAQIDFWEQKLAVAFFLARRMEQRYNSPWPTKITPNGLGGARLL